MHLLAFLYDDSDIIVKVFDTNDTDTQAESIAKIKAWVEDKGWVLQGAVVIDQILLNHSGDGPLGPYVDPEWATGDIDFLEFIHL